MDQATLDSLASHAAQRIRGVPHEEEEPKVLVVDFFRNSPGTYSRLGTLLADKFSESLAAYATGFKILDRGILKEYLIQNWTRLEDLQSYDVCLRIARQLGASGVVLGTLYEENGQLSFTLHLEGFDLPPRTKDIFESADERIRFPLTEELRSLLFQPGPSYSRKADEIPEEPGIVRFGSLGVTLPHCIHCPPPDYSDAARSVKFQGTVVLSIVVTAEGEVTSIYVLKGAPFGLTAKTIEATKNWRFEVGRRDGKPISVRVETENTFHLF